MLILHCAVKKIWNIMKKLYQNFWNYTNINDIITIKPIFQEDNPIYCINGYSIRGFYDRGNFVVNLGCY